MSDTKHRWCKLTSGPACSIRCACARAIFRLHNTPTPCALQFHRCPHLRLPPLVSDSGRHVLIKRVKGGKGEDAMWKLRGREDGMVEGKNEGEKCCGQQCGACKQSGERTGARKPTKKTNTIHVVTSPLNHNLNHHQNLQPKLATKTSNHKDCTFADSFACATSACATVSSALIVSTCFS